MKKTGIAAALLLSPLMMVRQAPSQDTANAAEAQFQQRVLPYMQKYCVACHNAKVKTANIDIASLKSHSTLDSEGATWEKILRKIRTGEMPPPKLPRAPQTESDWVVSFGEARLDEVALRHPDPGRVPVHRLNRAEYNNAVRDIFGIDFQPANDFPADDSGYGFDNIAGVLSLPPVLLEKYLRAADRIAREATGLVSLKPALQRLSIDRRINQGRRISDEMPAGSRGGALIQHRFPADAEYLIRVRLRGEVDPAAPPMLDFRLDGKRIQRIEARMSTAEEDEEQRRFEVRVPVEAGIHTIGVTFLQEFAAPEHADAVPDANGKIRPKQVAADWIEVGGPFDVKAPAKTVARKALVTCSPASAAEAERCAITILSEKARLAYRRPVTAPERATLQRFYRKGLADSGTFEGGLALGLKAILVSPNFLFRIEADPAGAKPDSMVPVTDLQLASRLSFFLWSSVPDEELLSAAEQNRLSQPEVLHAQIQRMLKDPRSAALTDNFAGQWLHLRNLASVKPDPEKFPDFDDELREAMRKETELFFSAVLREDRNVLDFLDAPFTYVNERLARHYGIKGVEGRAFRRVSLEGTSRGGVLTQASVLTVSSYPTRTSPVIRGKWILENMLGAPPPPPPPDVPELKTEGVGKTVSLRKQLEQHRANSACASCHNKMDALGFALENFDAVGRFRTHDGDFEIDSAGMLPNGRSFQNASDLRQVLRTDNREFVNSLTEKLMTYALGRGLERYDKPNVRKIGREVASKEYRFSALVLGVVNSTPFRMRRVGPQLGEIANARH